MKFARLLAATVLFTSPLAYRQVGCQQVDSASKADYPPLVGSGSIVRFKRYGETTLHYGEVSRIGTDSLILATCDHCSQLQFHRGEISGLEVYRGSTGVRNGLLGFLGGMVAAAGVTAVVINEQQCHDDLCGLRYMAVPAAGIAGAFVGLLVGIALAKETWEPIP